MPSCSQPPEFPITPKLAAAIRLFLHSQLFITPPSPTHPFTNQTVIITGANRGLGLEAARHFHRLNCARLILAVRTVEKGHAAKEDILSSAERSHANSTSAPAPASASAPESDAAARIHVWPLDLRSTASTIAFADRVKRELDRVDVFVASAGVSTAAFELVEGVEQVVQVNVLNTCLLVLLLLPKLQEYTAVGGDSVPHLVVVASDAHRLTSFPEVNVPDLYLGMSGREGFDQFHRYNATKLIQVLFIRELVARLTKRANAKIRLPLPIPSSPPTPTSTPTAEADAGATPPVIINLVNPGLSSTTSDGKPFPLHVRIFRRILSRTVEVGSRTLVLAASAPASSHGEYQSDGANQDVEAWIYSYVGQRVQVKVFEQTMRILEGRCPGVARGVGLE
ncbi:NAD(P)-binding protein [Aspergillus carlsbadensis]|nr:NAD(P)-binding protein [Aspergillus carlsbadensis]